VSEEPQGYAAHITGPTAEPSAPDLPTEGQAHPTTGIHPALASARESLHVINGTRQDHRYFTPISEGANAAEAILIRDMQHTNAAMNAQTNIRQLAARTPYMREVKGREFLDKVYEILSDLTRLP
jgi:hypothetical protein